MIKQNLTKILADLLADKRKYICYQFFHIGFAYVSVTDQKHSWQGFHQKDPGRELLLQPSVDHLNLTKNEEKKIRGSSGKHVS